MLRVSSQQHGKAHESHGMAPLLRPRVQVLGAASSQDRRVENSLLARSLGPSKRSPGGMGKVMGRRTLFGEGKDSGRSCVQNVVKRNGVETFRYAPGTMPTALPKS
jgi:hypothetical protein